MEELINKDFFDECTHSYYKELFDLYGRANKGMIDLEQFKSLSTCMRLALNPEELQEIFSKYVENNENGKVSFETYMELVMETSGNKLYFDAATLHQQLKLRNVKLSYKVIERMISSQDRLISTSEFPLIMKKISEYWEVFQIFDINKDGLLDFGEMIKALEKYSKINNIHAVIDETKRRFSDVDINRDGCVDFSEFLDMIEMKQVDGTHAVLAFSQIDINGDGFISKDELVTFLEKIGDKNSQENAKKMISFVDKNLDNKVSFLEFQKIFNHF